MMLAIALGVILNPLNSSMVAVALVAIHSDFHVDIGTTTWIVSAFYLTGAVGQPLMGRLADLWGARRVFLTGVGAAAVVCALAPLSPTFGWLVAARAVQALATSTAFPAGLGLMRAAGGQRVPASSLAVLAVAASVSAALGPTNGGLLLATWGWQGIFLVNIPITVTSVVLGRLWLPAPPPADTGSAGLAALDLPGVALFAATLIPILGVLLYFGSATDWILIGIVPVAATALAVRELRHPAPFFDIRLLGRNPAMIGVFVQFASVTFVYYSFFFGLPLWLEQVANFDARAAGLLILPLTGMAVIVAPIASRVISRSGPRLPLTVGSLFMLAGTLLLVTLTRGVPIPLFLVVMFVLGVPNGINNLGLQAALYGVTPRERISWAAGQFQTFRYIGATLAAAMLGSVFKTGATTSGLHRIAAVLVIVAAVLTVANVAARWGQAQAAEVGPQPRP